MSFLLIAVTLNCIVKLNFRMNRQSLRKDLLKQQTLTFLCKVWSVKKEENELSEWPGSQPRE